MNFAGHAVGVSEACRLIEVCQFTSTRRLRVRRPQLATASPGLLLPNMSTPTPGKRPGDVMGISKHPNPITPAHVVSPSKLRYLCSAIAGNGGSPMRLANACAATGATRWPVRRNRKVAYRPNTVVYRNWNATCGAGRIEGRHVVCDTCLLLTTPDPCSHGAHNIHPTLASHTGNILCSMWTHRGVAVCRKSRHHSIWFPGDPSPGARTSSHKLVHKADLHV